MMLHRLTALAGAVTLLLLPGTGCVQEPSDSAIPWADAGPGGRTPRDPDPTEPSPTDAGTEREVVSLEDAPPPAGNGDLLTLAGGELVVASDPFRDRIWTARVSPAAPSLSIALEPGDEPGRMAVDGAGRVHVVLRGSGVLASFFPTSEDAPIRRPVCAAPRGVAWDEASGLVHVACASGRLVSFTPEGAEPVRDVSLPRDLRDVVPAGDGRLYVSRHRSADVLIVDADGNLQRRVEIPRMTIEDRTVRGGLAPLEANTAWRMRRDPTGDGVWLLHQQAVSASIAVDEIGYASFGCGGVVKSSLSRIDGDGNVLWTRAIEDAVLTVDFAPADLRSGLRRVYFASAVTGDLGIGRVFIADVYPLAYTEDDGCEAQDFRWRENQTTAIAMTPAGSYVAFQPEPAAFLVNGELVPLPDAEPQYDTGHYLFHFASRDARVACASCHPDGGDDGHLWKLGSEEGRRTPSLLGGLLETAPFHWTGDQPDIRAIMSSTFSDRMMGGILSIEEADAVGDWLDALPTVPRDVADSEAVSRGRAVFEGEAVGCVGCHSGEPLTNNETVSVAEGLLIQVPSLRGVVDRDPWMHDGCAETLEETLGACDGTTRTHGDPRELTDAETADLVAYLESL